MLEFTIQLETTRQGLKSQAQNYLVSRITFQAALCEILNLERKITALFLNLLSFYLNKSFKFLCLVSVLILKYLPKETSILLISRVFILFTACVAGVQPLNLVSIDTMRNSKRMKLLTDTLSTHAFRVITSSQLICRT